MSQTWHQCCSSSTSVSSHVTQAEHVSVVTQRSWRPVQLFIICCDHTWRHEAWTYLLWSILHVKGRTKGLFLLSLQFEGHVDLHRRLLSISWFTVTLLYAQTVITGPYETHSSSICAWKIILKKWFMVIFKWRKELSRPINVPTRHWPHWSHKPRPFSQNTFISDVIWCLLTFCPYSINVTGSIWKCVTALINADVLFRRVNYL